MTSELFAMLTDAEQADALDEARDEWDRDCRDAGLVQLTCWEGDRALTLADAVHPHDREDQARVLRWVMHAKQPPRCPDFDEIMAGRMVAFVPEPGGDVRRMPIAAPEERS